MAHGKVQVIGTSHVAAESISLVRSRIESTKPDIVAVELDARRAHALLHGAKPRLSLGMVRVMGVKGFLFFALASFLQRKIGQVVGVEPGSDMKAALEAAIKANAKIALIDRSIELTMRRLDRALTWKERARFFADMLVGPFSREVRELGSVDLRKVPSREVISKVLALLKAKYPALYAVLVEERNEHMANALADIVRRHPDSSVVAVVGAGHEDSLAALLRQKLGEN